MGASILWWISRIYMLIHLIKSMLVAPPTKCGYDVWQLRENQQTKISKHNTRTLRRKNKSFRSSKVSNCIVCDQRCVQWLKERLLHAAVFVNFFHENSIFLKKTFVWLNHYVEAKLKTYQKLNESHTNNIIQAFVKMPLSWNRPCKSLFFTYILYV